MIYKGKGGRCYSLVSSAIKVLLNQLLHAGDRTCSFISHLNSQWSIQLCCHHSGGNYSNTCKPSLSYQIPWIRSSFLKLSDSKTDLEVLLVSSHQQLTILLPARRDGWWFPHCSSHNGEGPWGNVQHQHDHGVPGHVHTLCQSVQYHIRNIAKIRTFLDRNSCGRIVHAFVMSQLNLDDALLTGTIGNTVSNCTSNVQNIAAWVGTRMCGDHITPVLKDHCWLPVQWRIKYKVLLQAYKAQYGLDPTHISELLHPHHPSCAPRSAIHSRLLCEPMTCPPGETKHLAGQPVLWNALSCSIRTTDSLDTFISTLKTCLFTSKSVRSLFTCPYSH